MIFFFFFFEEKFCEAMAGGQALRFEELPWLFPFCLTFRIWDLGFRKQWIVPTPFSAWICS